MVWHKYGLVHQANVPASVAHDIWLTQPLCLLVIAICNGIKQGVHSSVAGILGCTQAYKKTSMHYAIQNDPGPEATDSSLLALAEKQLRGSGVQLAASGLDGSWTIDLSKIHA